MVLVKHAQPVLDGTKPAREWGLTAKGEEQAKRLGAALRPFIPCHLVSSPEPKALRTCEIVADELDASMRVVEGLREIDRPVLPIMPASEHEQLNARIFTEFEHRVMGRESAQEARQRFGDAVTTEALRTEANDLIVVAHGTVISLFVSEHNDVDSFGLWRRLQCPSFVVLENSSFRLLDVVDGSAGQFQAGGS